MLDGDDRLETTGFDVSGERGHPSGIGGDPGRDGCYDGELHGTGRPLLRRMSSQHRSRDMPGLLHADRTGDSSSVGSGASVGSVVTVGLGNVARLKRPDRGPARLQDRAVRGRPVGRRGGAAPGEQFAPITATGGGGAVAPPWSAAGPAPGAEAAARTAGWSTVGDFAVVGGRLGLDLRGETP